MQTEGTKNLTRWFYFFLFFHFICWSVVPILVRYNLPLDSIEGAIWGQQLEWGYDKNPYLNAWATAFAITVGGYSGWMIYLFSQISVCVCFWVIWTIGKKIFTPTYALIAVLVLESVQYFNFHAIDFNDNTLELGLWALSIYFFYYALKTARARDWILLGLFAGLSMMAKYYSAALLAVMVLFFFTQPANRQQLKRLPPYLCLLTFSLVILPHVIWLFSHDFITVTYVFERASSPPHWTNHLFYPAQFALQQIQTFLPALFIFGFLCVGQKFQQVKISDFNKKFLIYMAIGPFLLTILLSVSLGIKLRAGWGMPLLSFWSLSILIYLKPTLTNKKIKHFLLFSFSLLVVLLSAYSLSLIYSTKPSSANFPGREIAQYVTTRWHNTYHTKLAYVAGSRWVGGNIGFYSADHPAVFVEWELRRAPWIALDQFKKTGAVFIWSISDKEEMPRDVANQYPNLLPVEILTFNWKRNPDHLPPIRLGIAFLPPA